MGFKSGLEVGGFQLISATQTWNVPVSELYTSESSWVLDYSKHVHISIYIFTLDIYVNLIEIIFNIKTLIYKIYLQKIGGPRGTSFYSSSFGYPPLAFVTSLQGTYQAGFWGYGWWRKSPLGWMEPVVNNGDKLAINKGEHQLVWGNFYRSI